MKKLFITSMILLCGFMFAKAQLGGANQYTHSGAQRTNTSGVNWGVRFGMNVSKLKGDKDTDLDDFKGRIGFHLGVAADYEFRNSMFLESGLYITTKGAKHDDDDEYEEWKDKYNITYLQLPVLYAFKYDLGNDTKFHIKAGPYFAVGLAAKNKWEVTYRGETEKEDTKGFGKGKEGDYKTGLKRGDVGLLFGVGISMKQYYLGMNYEVGLTNINAYDDEGKIKTGSFNISLGYNF